MSLICVIDPLSILPGVDIHQKFGRRFDDCDIIEKVAIGAVPAEIKVWAAPRAFGEQHTTQQSCDHIDCDLLFDGFG